MKFRYLLYLLLVPLLLIGFAWLFLQASAWLTQPRAVQATPVASHSSELETPSPIPTHAGGPAPSPSPTIRMIVGPFTQEQAPSIALTTLDGIPFKLEDSRGKIVVINFWASWCGPCKEEMPLLQAAYEKHHADGLLVLGVNTTYQDNRQDAEQFVRQTGAKFPILMDDSGSVSQDYRVISIPMTFFVDREGTIRHYQMGSLTADQLQRYLDELLK